KAKELEQPVAQIDRGPDEPPPQAPAHWQRQISRRVVGEYVPLPKAIPAETPPWRRSTAAGDQRSGERLKLKNRPNRPDAVQKPRLRDEGALLTSLQNTARELDIESKEGTGTALLEAALGKKNRDRKSASLSAPLEDLLASRDDLKGLPLLLGKACETDE